MFAISSPEKEEQSQFLQDAELHNPQERLGFVKWTQILAIPTILASLTQVAAATFLYIYHPSILSLCLAIGGGIFFIAALLAAIWAGKTKKALVEEDHALGQAPPSSRLTNVVFFISFFLAASTLIFITAIYAHHSWNEDYFQAAVSDPSAWIKTYGNYTVDQVSNFYRNVILAIAGCQITYLFFFLLASRSAFKFLDFGNRSMAQFVYIANTLQLAAGLALIYFSHNLKGYASFDHISANFPLWNIHALWIIGIVVSSITLFVFIFNWRKWRIGFFFIAFFLLIVVVGLINFTGYAYRHARYAHTYYESEKHCPGRLGAANIADLTAHGCPSKYVIVNSTVSTKCDNAWLGELWEQDVGVTAAQQKHQQGCLNEACCGIVANYYTSPLYLLAHIALLTTILAGLVSVGSYYLWYINWLDYGITKSAKDLGWFALKLALVGVFCWLYFAVPLSTPTEYGSHVKVVPTSTANVTYISPKDIGDNACYSIGNVSLSFNKTACDNTNCAGYSLVVYLLASQATWSVPSNKTVKSYEILDVTDKNVQFPNATTSDGYLALKGDPTVIQKALASQITVCPIQPGKDTLISMKVKQIKTSTARLLQWTTESIPTTSVALGLEQNLTEVLRGTVGTESSRFKWTTVSSAKVDIYRASEGTLIGTVDTDSNGDFSYALTKYAANKPYLVKVAITAPGFMPLNYSAQIGGFPTRVSTELGFIELFRFPGRILATTTTPVSSTGKPEGPMGRPDGPRDRPEGPRDRPEGPRPLNGTDTGRFPNSSNTGPGPRPLNGTDTGRFPNSSNTTGPMNRTGPGPIKEPYVVNRTVVNTSKTINFTVGPNESAIILSIVSAIDGTYVYGAHASVYPGGDTQAIQGKSMYTENLFGNLVYFRNVSKGNYVLRVTHDQYGEHVRNLVVRGGVVNVSIALVPVVTQNHFQLVLNLPDRQDFTLQANFEGEDGNTCSLSSLVSSCGGLSKFTEERQFDSLKVGTYGQHYYLFYVRYLPQPSLRPTGLIDTNVDIPIYERIALAAVNATAKPLTTTAPATGKPLPTGAPVASTNTTNATANATKAYITTTNTSNMTVTVSTNASNDTRIPIDVTSDFLNDTLTINATTGSNAQITVGDPFPVTDSTSTGGLLDTYAEIPRYNRLLATTTPVATTGKPLTAAPTASANTTTTNVTKATTTTTPLNATAVAGSNKTAVVGSNTTAATGSNATGVVGTTTTTTTTPVGYNATTTTPVGYNATTITPVGYNATTTTPVGYNATTSTPAGYNATTTASNETAIPTNFTGDFTNGTLTINPLFNTTGTLGEPYPIIRNPDFLPIDVTDTASDRDWAYKFNPDHTTIALGDIGRTHRRLIQDDFLPVRPLTKSAVFLDIYLPELDTLAGRLYAPSQVPTGVAEDGSLTWLAFCMDGRKGPSSIRALNTYWTPDTFGGAIPNAQTICAPLYAGSTVVGGSSTETLTTPQ